MNSGCINELQAYDYNYRYSYCSDMAIANITENGREMKYEELFCSADLNNDVHNRLTSLAVSAVNIFLSATAFLGNTLILVDPSNSCFAIWRYPTSVLVLFRSPSLSSFGFLPFTNDGISVATYLFHL